MFVESIQIAPHLSGRRLVRRMHVLRVKKTIIRGRNVFGPCPSCRAHHYILDMKTIDQNEHFPEILFSFRERESFLTMLFGMVNARTSNTIFPS
jgi:hypothetical protein